MNDTIERAPIQQELQAGALLEHIVNIAVEESKR
jgi:hypothetical protein